MVDVSAKQVTTRTAKAHGFVTMKPRVVAAVRRLKNPKGSPLEVARIAGIAAMSGRISQGLDHFLKFHDRTRPSMSHDQRHRIGMTGTNVDKMYPDSVDGGFELRKAVEPRLPRAPVVFFEPVLTDFLRVRERQSLRPVIDTLALGESSGPQAAFQIVEFGVGRLDFERDDFVAHGCLTLRIDLGTKSDQSRNELSVSS